MKHLFVIDPIDTQTLELNSSVKLAYALHADGSKVWFTSIRALTVATAASCPVCECRAITFTDADFRSICIDPASEIRPLNYFAAVHMRKDPPFDLQYLTATHILDHVDVPVFNSPVALRNLNEKISILHFPAASIPALVSADSKQLLAFAQQYDEIVIKPLYLYGGQGVKRVKRLDYDKILQTSTPLFVQPFYNEVTAGEVRGFFAFGEPQAWCLKVPAAGNFLANTSYGATLKSYQPKPDELQLLTQVAKSLYEVGVFFVGFDMIAGKISEINITSPRLLLPVQLDLAPYHRIVAQISEYLACDN